MTTFMQVLQNFHSSCQRMASNRACWFASAALESPHAIVGQKRSARPNPAIALPPHWVDVVNQHYVDAVLAADAIKASTFCRRRLFEQGSHRLCAGLAAVDIAAKNCAAEWKPHSTILPGIEK